MGLDDLLSVAAEDGPRAMAHDRRRDRRRAVVISVAAVVAATLVGVGAGLAASLVDGDDRAPSGLPATVAPTSTSPGEVSASPSAVPSSAGPTASVDVPPSGTDTGFLVSGRRVDQEPVVAELRFDRVQFLTGEEAERAAARNGDEVDNDYYVVNDNPRLRVVQLTETTTISGDASFNSWAGEGGQSGPRPRTLDELLRFLGTDQGRATLFDLRYDRAGFVTAVVERYVP